MRKMATEGTFYSGRRGDKVIYVLNFDKVGVHNVLRVRLYVSSLLHFFLMWS